MSNDRDRATDRLARTFQDSLSAAAAEAPSFEDVAAYVEGRLQGAERGLFEERMAGDPFLRAEVQDLRDLRTEMAVTRSRPAWTGLAAAAVLVAALAGAYAWSRRAPEGPETASGPAPNPAPAIVARLQDQAGAITLRADGSLEGMTLPPHLAKTVGDALRTGRMDVPALRADLAVAPVTAMGAGGASAAFEPVAPLTTIVRSDRPTFRFTALPRARAYVVAVYDLELERVAASPRLRTTEWAPERPLPRGRTYVWQVEAETPEGPVTVPAPPAAEARFHVATAEAAAQVEAAVASGSHLAAGVALAEAGFRQEAVEQFERLAALNPQSGEAKKLLELSRASRPRR